MSGPHLSLSLSRELWHEILRAALPFHVAGGAYTLLGMARGAVAQLQVRDRVVGLLEDWRTPQPLVRIGERAREVWRDNRATLVERLDDLVHVEGTWSVEVDDLGTDLVYGQQKVTADAWVRGVAEGRITFLREGVSLPFRVERRLGATVALGRIRWSKQEDAVIGNIQDLALHLGDHAVLQMISRLLELGVSQQVDTAAAVPVLKREQVEGLVGPAGGPLNLQMGVDDMRLDITDEQMTLSVRFGFARKPEQDQLTDRDVS